MALSSMQHIPESLLDAVRKHDCIPFIGSGLSLPFGLPTWSTLLHELAETCSREKKPNPDVILALEKDGDYIGAAQKAVEKLGLHAFRTYLTSRLRRYERSRPLVVQSLLWKLEPPLIITTNFDTLLEDAAPQRALVITAAHRPELLDIFRKGDGCQHRLFKIHGSIDQFDTIVLTADQYMDLYGVEEINALNLALYQPVLGHTLLFIGFGMTDPGVLATLRRTARLFNNFQGPHYALVKRNDVDASSLWTQYKVQVVWYDDHTEVESLLRGLCREASRGQRQDVDSLRDEGPAAVIDGVSSSRGVRSVGHSARVPASLADVRRRSIGECILVVGGVVGDQCRCWDGNQVAITKIPEFLRVEPELEAVRRATEHEYVTLGYMTSPRLALVEAHVEPMDNFRFGDLSITAQYTDWALVDGIQRTLEAQRGEEGSDLARRFWRSVTQVVAEGKALDFPHHIAVHCLVVSADGKVILNRRVGVSNQRGRISASFEEQFQVPHIYPARGRQPSRVFDGDRSATDAVIRGAKEELGIVLKPSDIVFLGLAMETSSIAANLLAFARSEVDAEEIYASWKLAEDRGENAMVPVSLLPTFDVDSVAGLVSTPEFVCPDPTYTGAWHASSQARLALALVHEFGWNAASEHLSVDALAC